MCLWTPAKTGSGTGCSWEACEGTSLWTPAKAGSGTGGRFSGWGFLFLWTPEKAGSCTGKTCNTIMTFCLWTPAKTGSCTGRTLGFMQKPCGLPQKRALVQEWLNLLRYRFPVDSRKRGLLYRYCYYFIHFYNLWTPAKEGSCTGLSM